MFPGKLRGRVVITLGGFVVAFALKFIPVGSKVGFRLLRVMVHFALWLRFTRAGERQSVNFSRNCVIEKRNNLGKIRRAAFTRQIVTAAFDDL